MIRPYIYSLFIGIVSSISFGGYISNRLIISVIQASMYYGISLRIAQKMSFISQRLSKIFILATLCNPFAIISQHEILSDTLAMNVFLFAVLSGINQQKQHINRVIFITTQNVIIANMVFIRTAALPLSIVALISSIISSLGVKKLSIIRFLFELLLLILIIIASELYILMSISIDNIKHYEIYIISSSILIASLIQFVRCKLSMIPAYITILSVALAAYPQYVLLKEHAKINGGHINILGVAGQQIGWGMEIAKYSAFVSPCVVPIPSGVIIKNPLVKSKSENEVHQNKAVSVVSIGGWYLENPSQVFFHLYAVIQKESFGAYITKPYAWLSVTSLGLSALVKSIAMIRIPEFIRRMWIRWRSNWYHPNWEPQITLFLCISWMQNSLVAAESRFGHLIMLGIVIIAVEGILKWAECTKILILMTSVSILLTVIITIGDVYWIANYSYLGNLFRGACN